MQFGKAYVTRNYACSNKYRAHICDAQNINADELEFAVVMKVKEYFAQRDFDAMAEEIYMEYTKGEGTQATEKKEPAQIERKLADGTKAILAGADYSELNEEMARLKIRKAELEELLARSPELVLTKKMIAGKLKKDAQHLQNGDI